MFRSSNLTCTDFFFFFLLSGYQRNMGIFLKHLKGLQNGTAWGTCSSKGIMNQEEEPLSVPQELWKFWFSVFKDILSMEKPSAARTGIPVHSCCGALRGSGAPSCLSVCSFWGATQRVLCGSELQECLPCGWRLLRRSLWPSAGEMLGAFIFWLFCWPLEEMICNFPWALVFISVGVTEENASILNENSLVFLSDIIPAWTLHV